MQVFLAAHPAISFLPEINFVRRFLLPNTLAPKLANGGQTEVQRVIDEDPKLGRLPYQWSSILDAIPLETPLDEYEEAIFCKIVKTHKKNTTSYVGYKDALLIEAADTILKRWPESRIVHIIRDPRDVLASRKKAGWSKNYPNWRNIIAGRIQLRIASECAKTELGSRIHEVKYEDLLRRPEEVARDLCEFLELEYSHEMLDFSNRANDLVFKDEMQWKKNLFSPLMKGNSGKWKTELGAQEIALVEKAYRREFIKRGYQDSNAFSNLTVYGKLKIIGQLMWIKSLQAVYFLKKRVLG